MGGSSSGLQALRWDGENLVLLDQRALPGEEAYLRCGTCEQVARAVEDMAVRGAPAIGVAATYGLYLGVRGQEAAGPAAFRGHLAAAAARLLATRPTAVNLAWAVSRARAAAEQALARGGSPAAVRALLAEAGAILAEDVAANRRLGELGAALLPVGARVLTHCNTGALATAGYGTALGVIRAAREAGKGVSVLVGETRPRLQGARLTAWELGRLGIPHTLITDGMAAHFMRRREVDAVIVGADRIAANGDTANKIGTYSLAVLARAHGIPFYVAAPFSTVDPATAAGDQIPIEHRAPSEVTEIDGRMLAPRGTPAANPAFDMTPAELISAIITERGVLRPPYGPALAGAPVVQEV